jgi:hypothetical protein
MGNFFDDLYSSLFQSSEKVPLNHKENFVYKFSELQEAKDWSNGVEGEEIMAKISKNYAFKKLQLEEIPRVHILDSKYARGFAITYEEVFTPQTFSNLFLAFAQRVLALGYQQVSLDRKLEEINDQVRSTEKFYFKPPLQLPVADQLISQLYGNVAIEKITLNNQPNYLKVLATFYSDRLYQDPMPFEELVNQLFENKIDGQD